MKLADLQAKFQDAILSEDRTILDAITPSTRLDRAGRFAVYTDAYRLRLKGFLSEDFKALRQTLGDEDFDALAAAYVGAILSHHPNARWYARQLPEFMQTTAPWRDRGDLIGLARFERALADAFDEKNIAACKIETLAAFTAEDWPHLCFEFQESLTILTEAQGTVAAYETALADEPPPLDICEPPQQEAGAESIAIWRDPAHRVLYRKLSDAEALALIEAYAGKSFGEICSLLAFRNENDAVAERAAGFLAQWFADGLVTRVNRI